jgi:hypothetical protein
MFRRVLVVTDFPRYADWILECVSEIPGMEEILPVHVLTRPEDQTQQWLGRERAVLPADYRITGNDVGSIVIGRITLRIYLWLLPLALPLMRRALTK